MKIEKILFMLERMTECCMQSMLKMDKKNGVSYLHSLQENFQLIVNTNLDGKVGTNGGGTNPIFGVDGSPVVHDMFIQGLTMNGEWEAAPSWHTILLIPYGRGGAGFSVLDVTYPVIETGQGPLHMFSIFNDAINNRVLVADKDGFIEEHPYVRGGTNVSQSAEALKAQRNQDDS